MRRGAFSWLPQLRLRSSGGFTLVEMLVAMTLLSLLVLAMGSAFRVGSGFRPAARGHYVGGR